MLKSKVKFDKELFKRSVLYNIKTLYRKTLEEATQQQIFQAVCYAVKDQIVDCWMETQREYDKQDPKTVYYLSMEFLMGRALGNNLINMQAYKPVKEALTELGLDLNFVEDAEPDAALGNGGLGRLAACFWIPLPRLAIRHTAVASATATACLNRKSETAIRWKYRTYGWKTAIPLNCAALNMHRK